MVNPVSIPSGVFAGFPDTHKVYYTESFYDEASDMDFTIQFICACGLPVFRLRGDDFGFACEHCDSVCTLDSPETPCERCRELFSVDFEEG